MKIGRGCDRRGGEGVESGGRGSGGGGGIRITPHADYCSQARQF